MTDPYPERRRRNRLDRADHHEAARADRAAQRGPTPDQVKRALEEVGGHAVPGTPRTGALKALRDAADTDWETDTRFVRDFSITPGRPQHGAYRSDDHVGRYELRLPLVEVSDSAVPDTSCPECGAYDAIYTYHAHHHIAGSESVCCAECAAELYGNFWG